MQSRKLKFRNKTKKYEIYCPNNETERRDRKKNENKKTTGRRRNKLCVRACVCVRVCVCVCLCVCLLKNWAQKVGGNRRSKKQVKLQIRKIGDRTYHNMPIHVCVCVCVCVCVFPFPFPFPVFSFIYLCTRNISCSQNKKNIKIR